jgi:pyruvate/2-oxoglutarate dehydrogenase complex dihydrolipoamide dehydrogenase (E3) component
MAELLECDICVIGAGSGGLSVAAGASQMGASTVLIERAKMGGDCLNYGCVPSKALIAAAQAAHAVRRAPEFGVNAGALDVDFNRVHDHVHDVIAAIAPHDSVERFEGFGVTVILGHARFTGPREVEADGKRIRARRFVIATGSSPAAPPIPGLDGVPYFTNETIFDNCDAPDHLIIIGGGPIGVELAQAHCRLGVKVTVLEMFGVLGRDDPELADVVRRRLVEDGIEIHENIRIEDVEGNAGSIRVRLDGDNGPAIIEGSHLLVAAGRKPNIDGLDLDKAGIEFTPKGVTIDKRLRTTNKKVFAIGDIAGPFQFTHMAGYHAGIVIRNALFRLPAKVDYGAVPWVTYTDPELAWVGMSEADAQAKHGDIRVMRFPFDENDRAIAERTTDGLVKVITSKKGVVLGVGIVGPHAGELIQSWILPIARAMHIKHVAGLIAPYPTLGEAGKRAAGAYFTPSLFGDRVKMIVRLLAKLG